MHKITLLCSTHHEHGLCNADELQKILRALEPEVIFQEIRPSDHWSLEAQALATYSTFKACRSVRVDQFDMPTGLAAEAKKAIDSVFNCVKGRSEEYIQVEHDILNCEYRDGFEYLNSSAFANQSARMSEIEDEIINRTGDQSLIRALQWWRQLNQTREIEMVRSIYAYCRKNAFGTGVFLVGAAHKQGIVDAIEKYARTEAGLIDWITNYDCGIG